MLYVITGGMIGIALVLVPNLYAKSFYLSYFFGIIGLVIAAISLSVIVPFLAYKWKLIDSIS